MCLLDTESCSTDRAGCSLDVETSGKDNVPFDECGRLLCLLVQDGVPDDAGRIPNISQSLVKSLDTANNDPLLDAGQLHYLSKGLQCGQSLVEVKTALLEHWTLVNCNI